MMRRLHNLFLLLAFAAVSAAPAMAADIHSNGTGGGEWSAPSTWKGGKVPAAEDTAVIAMRDTVTFAQNHAEQVTCASLFLDPEAVLILKPIEDATTALTVAGPIESYGVLKIEAQRVPDAILELRFGGPGGNHEFNMRPNSALLVYGREGYSEAGPNVRIIGYEDPAVREHAVIISRGESSVEVNQAKLSDVGLVFYDIDNTGSKATERLNIRNNQFHGYSRVNLYRCDTPSVRGNTFEIAGKSHIYPAIHFTHVKLGDIRENRITGPFARGIMIQYDTDSSASSNIIEGTNEGIYWHGENGMLKNNLIKNTNNGVQMHAGSAVLEDVVVDNCKTGYHATQFAVQMTTCRSRNMGEESTVMYLNEATAKLLNCDIGYDQIKTGKQPWSGYWAESMQYLVVKVNGDVPEGAMVEPRTSKQSGGVPKGKADLNVRNAPARLDRDRLTPLPRSQNALVLRAWRLENNGKVSSAPFYDLRVLAPASPGENPKELSTQIIEPTEAWFRAEPDAPEPTVEVNLQ